MKKKNIKNVFNIILILCLVLPQMQTVVLASNNENMKEENESHISLSQYNDLEKKSDKNGSVRVIVELDESFTPEGKISKNKIEIQKKKIKVAQEDVIANLHKKGQKNAKNITSFKTIPFMALEVDSEGLKALSESEKVKNIIEDIKISKSIIEENEEVDVIQPQLNVTNNLMDTEKAWTAGYTGQGKTVAILDTGVDKYHPFLRNKVVSEACYSSTGHCSGNARELTGPDSAVDTEGHGTHVAGIATGNGTQFSGVAKNANIIAIKVLADDGSGSFSDLLNGLERVYLLRNQYAISAVNLSLGGGRFYSSCDSTYSSLKSMVDNLKSVGIATIAASGNEYYKNSISAPACISSVISVGATNNSDAVASFSNSSSYLDVLAPGNPVYSSIPGGGYASYSGTSMATPQVVGGFTLVKQKYPSATVDQIVSYIRQNGVNVRDTANNIITPRLDFSWMETSLPALVQVQKPTWNGDVIQWVGVTNASQYEVKLYRGTTLVTTERVASSDRQFNFASLMTSPGGYSATVQAIGDPTNYRDGLISIPSNENRKTYALNQVQKPTWNGDAIQWVGVTNANQYEVKLYRGTTLVNTQRVEDIVRQYNFASAMTSSGVYTVTVQAIGDHTNYGDGQTSLPSDGVQKEILYFEDFESNNGNFTVDGSYSTWQWGAPTSGPNSAFSGTNVWATNLSGNYHDNENSYIVSPNLDLSNVGSPITLSWMQYAVTENGFDYLNVEISKDSGQTWDSIYRNTGTINQNWGSHEVTIDNSYAVPDFKVRFRLATDSSVTTAGVYIDDVKMTVSRLAPTLDQVQKPTWNGDVINWNGIANANQYDIKLYRGTTLINTQRLEASVQEYNYAAQMTTPGEYTATVQAIGNQTNYRDGLISSPSDVNRKTIALDQVQQPIWNNDVIQWNGIANAYQYEVKLYRGTTLINTERVGAYVQQVDYAALMTTPGGYSVTVQAIGDQTNYRDGLISHPSNVNSKFMTLDQDQKPTWNGDVIQWSGVANANQYEIKLYRGTTLINTQRVSASVQQYNYDALMTIPSDYTVTVQAIGEDTNYLDGPISSPSDVNRKIMTLAQVQKPTWNGDVIQWYVVSNAYQYEVKLYRGTSLIKTQRVAASVRQVNYASLMMTPGGYSVTVQAVGDNSYYRNGLVSLSSNLKITLYQVQKPTWNGDVIQWSGTANAYQYEVKLYRGTTLIKTLRVAASVRQVNYAALMSMSGSYKVTVQAIGDNRSYRNGPVSVSSNLKITLNQVQKPTWKTDVIQWVGVAHTYQYEVKLYRGTTLIKTLRVAASVRQVNYAGLMNRPGSYTVSVRAIGDNRSSRNGSVSARSNQKITLNQVQKPTWSSNTIKWNGVSKAAQYEVKLYRGSTLVNTKRVAANVRQINYATQMKKSGKYTVTVQAIGDNKSYRNGPISARSNQKSK
ncbi:S8 family serine peptidase [Bacillus sp. ISL-7]|uniref:S8 family serine peptidase n=1 Tax=Bacillus sp. ISL-7 TaxID=2819136 RepID=UPI001BEBA0AE|nr:S8 family serine peptidase [Bacillus sp. ISL-7]MBT2738105.1 S8 family serine peptidase [Bacillus sp. ISL-7]